MSGRSTTDRPLSSLVEPSIVAEPLHERHGEVTALVHHVAMMIDRADHIASFVSERWTDVTEVEGLGPLIRAHGIDLGIPGAEPASIARGTPVYACEDAEPSRVLRRMAEAHVRYLFVVGSVGVVGVVDIRDLVERAAALAWSDGVAVNGNGNGFRGPYGDSLL